MIATKHDRHLATRSAHGSDEQPPAVPTSTTKRRTEYTGCLTTSTQSTHSEMYNHLSARVKKYYYGSGDDTKPFSKWLLRHEYTVVTEAARLPSEMETRLVLDKLGQAEFDRLVDHIAPTNPSQMPQKYLISTLKELFRDKVSITRRRIEILNYWYEKSTSITEHLDHINRHAADFDRSKLINDNFCILLLLQSLCFSTDNDELKKIALRAREESKHNPQRRHRRARSPHERFIGTKNPRKPEAFSSVRSERRAI